MGTDATLDTKPPDGLEWVQHAWPTEGDSEEQRAVKKRQLEKLLHVKVSRVALARTRQSGISGTTAARSGSASRPPLDLAPPSEGQWRKTAKHQQADRQRQLKERLFVRRRSDVRQGEEEEGGGEDPIQSVDGASEAATPLQAAPAALQLSTEAAAAGCMESAAQEQRAGLGEPAGRLQAAELAPLPGHLATPPGPSQGPTQPRQPHQQSAGSGATPGSTITPAAAARGRRRGGATAASRGLPALLGAGLAAGSGGPAPPLATASLPTQQLPGVAGGGGVRGRRAWQPQQRSNPLHLLRNAAPSQQQQLSQRQHSQPPPPQQQQRSGSGGLMGCEPGAADEGAGEPPAGELPNPVALLLGPQAAQAEQQAAVQGAGQQQAAPSGARRRQAGSAHVGAEQAQQAHQAATAGQRGAATKQQPRPAQPQRGTGPQQRQHAAGGTGGMQGGSALRPSAAPRASDWGSLPPTPACMYAFSPDTLAPAGGTAAAAAAARPTNSGSRPAPSPACVLQLGGSCSDATPAVAGAAATVSRVAHASCVAETPALPSSSAAGPGGGGRQQAALQLARSEGGRARQLFVAETPVCAGGAVEPPPGLPGSALHAARTPAAAAGSCSLAAGLQLLLPQPVLHAAPTADGRHLALLLGSYAPAGEPTDVLVLCLPERAPAAAAAAPPSATAVDGAAAAPSPGGGADPAGVRVVASFAVQRARCAEGLELTPNCLQLSSDGRAGLHLILSAALELAEQPPPPQPAILVLTLPAHTDGAAAGGDGGGGGRRAAGAVLAVEHATPLTAVLLDGPASLLAAGDGGEVRRLEFGQLWRTYTWGRSLPPAAFRSVHFEDVQHLLAYRCPTSGRRLLAGLSSHGAAAVWDVAGNVLLMARADAHYRLKSLQPVPPVAAGLAAAARQAGGASAGPPQLFLGLVQSRSSGEQRVAAVVLSPAGLAISGGSLLAPAPPGGPAPRRHRRQGPAAVQATAVRVAGHGCWVGTADGQVLDCCPAAGGGNGDAEAAAMPLPCCRGGAGALTSLCAVPAGVGSEGGGGGVAAQSGEPASWRLVAATAGGACTVLAR